MPISEERILERFQLRKTLRQKRAFIKYATEELKKAGVEARLEREGAISGTNLIVGDADTADVIFTAHYDTAPVMLVPNFITPRNVPLYLAYQLAIVALMAALAWLLAYIATTLGLPREAKTPLFGVILMLESLSMMLGFANRRTANDNTSGVATVLKLAEALPQELKGRVAFALFDNEELGTLGSLAFAKRHRHARRHAAIINFDCVGDGDTLALILPKGCPESLEKSVREAYRVSADGGKTFAVFHARGTFYPSDHMNFSLGTGAAAFRKTKRGLYYIPRLHTMADTRLERENIRLFVERSLAFAKAYSDRKREVS